jgi:hypothetical protein
VHGQSVEQTNQVEEPVDLAALAARDRTPAVLRLEPPERIGEHVHGG